jgi:small subunit ribosomal protein S2
MRVVSMKKMLESGVHFGHRTHRWHPKMEPYIFTERNNIHIIDLEQTLEALTEAYLLVRDTVAEGGKVLFVGTKRQAQETIQLEAERCNMPWVTRRWLGGTLTNWNTIQQRINELNRLERLRDRGDFDILTKKEALGKTRQIERLEMLFGGIRDMNGNPDILFVVDAGREATAVHEANLLEIPVVAMVDTNCNPSNIDYPIPSNDDAIRAIKLMVGKIADAVLEGQAMRKDLEEERPPEADVDYQKTAELSDEELLGESTLAKLEAQKEEEAEEVSEEEEAVEETAEEIEEAEEIAEEEEASEEAEEEQEEAPEEEAEEETADEESEEDEA